MAKRYRFTAGEKGQIGVFAVFSEFGTLKDPKGGGGFLCFPGELLCQWLKNILTHLAGSRLVLHSGNSTGPGLEPASVAINGKAPF